jgi:hypothetical protein
MDTTGVVISVTKSPDVTYIASPGWSVNGLSYSIGNLAAFRSGMVTYVVRLPASFTTTMDPFINVFGIADNGPGGLPIASTARATALGLPDLVIVTDSVTLSPTRPVVGQPFTATMIIRNQGTGAACNPKKLALGLGCRSSFISVFITTTRPTSFGFQNSYSNYGYGDVIPVPVFSADGNGSGLGPGISTTLAITGIVASGSGSHTLYLKIDNYNCTPDNQGNSNCIRPDIQQGLIPESNEDNNVYGPVTISSYSIYLPLVLKK